MPVTEVSAQLLTAAPWINDGSGKAFNVLANAMTLLRTRLELDVFALDEMAQQELILKALPAPALAGTDQHDFYPRPVREVDVSRLQELMQHLGLTPVKPRSWHIRSSRRELPRRSFILCRTTLIA